MNNNPNSNQKEERKDPNALRNKKIGYLYLQGKPVKQISEKFSLSDSTIYRVLRRYSIDTSRKQGEVRASYRKKILQGVRQKKSIVEIAAVLKLPPEIVNGILTTELKKLQKQKEIDKQKELANRKSGEKKLTDKAKIDKTTFATPTGKVDTVSKDKAPQRLLTPLEQKGYFMNKNTLYKEAPTEPADAEFDMVMQLLNQQSVSLTKTDRSILDLLRACLKYSSSNYNMTDYSGDPYLLPDYLLPLDIMIQKDIVARQHKGLTVAETAKHHRIDEETVQGVLSGQLSRTAFRNNYFLSLSNLMINDGE